MYDGMQATLLTGRETLEVVGESHYQANLWSIVGTQPTSEGTRCDGIAILVPEKTNPYDPNAIAVWINGLQVGYLSREDAAAYRPGLMKLMERQPVALEASIVGGGRGGKPLLGVFLDHDPADFGLAEPSPRQNEPALRTGFGAADTTDLLDDSYDLSWVDSLSEDSPRAIGQLETLLADDPDPIDRHFMFCELERRWYRLRDFDATALDNYDDACRRHDSEMDGIRVALVTKFGAVPLLETYRQQCVRQQKARNWTEALRWAERGLALYGDAAANEEWCADLRKRAARFEAKSNPPVRKPARPPSRATVVAVDEVETLTCNRCGAQWQRTRMRGRKPHLCDACRRTP
jgi:hypothetical protein